MNFRFAPSPLPRQLERTWGPWWMLHVNIISNNNNNHLLPPFAQMHEVSIAGAWLTPAWLPVSSAAAIHSNLKSSVWERSPFRAIVSFNQSPKSRESHLVSYSRSCACWAVRAVSAKRALVRRSLFPFLGRQLRDSSDNFSCQMRRSAFLSICTAIVGSPSRLLRSLFSRILSSDVSFSLLHLNFRR